MMMLDWSLGQNAFSMDTFRFFVEWFRSLYDIQWNFFGTNITLMQVLLCVGICSVVLDMFSKVFGLTTAQSESDAVIRKLEGQLRGW